MAMMQIGAGEFLVIALLALVVLGPERLPNAARFVGQVLGSVRSMATSFQTEMERASDGFVEDAARKKGQAQVDAERAKNFPHPDPDARTAITPPGDAQGSDSTTANSATASSTSANSANSATANEADTTPENGAGANGTAANGIGNSNAARTEPDRSEKPHSAPMYRVESSSDEPTSHLHADLARMATGNDDDSEVATTKDAGDDASQPDEVTESPDKTAPHGVTAKAPEPVDD